MATRLDTFKSTNTVICGPDITLTPVHLHFTGTSAHIGGLIKGARYRMLASQPCFILFGEDGVEAVDEETSMPVTAESAEFIMATGEYVAAITRGGDNGYIVFTPLTVGVS